MHLKCKINFCTGKYLPLYSVSRFIFRGTEFTKKINLKLKYTVKLLNFPECINSFLIT